MNHLIRSLGVLFFFSILGLFSLCGTGRLNNEDEKNIEKADLLKGMNLIIPDSSFTKIKIKRKEALKKNLLIKSKDDYVNGYVESNGKKIAVKARLKGDHPDHFETNRWSFRIISSDGSILNHKKISVQGIHTRNRLSEWLFHQLLAEENLIHLQYEFFPFCVNDTLCGIYAFESHFDNYLLTMANRELGPILKFNESDFWDYRVYKGKKNRDDLLMINSQIEVCNKKWCKKENNIKKSEKAIKMLDEFRHGRKAGKDVFDLKLWARFIAVNELMQGNHALRWHNLRFYLNPTTKKIEPIGFDCGSWFMKGKELYYTSSKVELFHQEMLKDKQYQELIRNEMIRISKKEYGKNFMDKTRNEIDERVLMIQKEEPDYKYWRSGIYNSQKRIIGLLNEAKDKAPVEGK